MKKKKPYHKGVKDKNGQLMALSIGMTIVLAVRDQPVPLIRGIYIHPIMEVRIVVNITLILALTKKNVSIGLYSDWDNSCSSYLWVCFSIS